MRCEEAGVQLLVVHARTRAQQYRPGVRMEEVEKICRAVSIPVLYNGDVDSAETALAALQKTGCNGLMVGRAALGNPWIFREIAAVMAGEPVPPAPSLRERLAVMERQIRGMCEETGEERGMREARKVAAGYLRGLQGAASLRRYAHSLTYYEDLHGLVEQAYVYNT